MSVHDFHHAWKTSSYSGSELLALMVIAGYTDEFGVAWCGLDTIARESRIGRRTITRVLPNLIGPELVWLDRSASTYYKTHDNAQSHLYIYLANRPKLYSDQIRQLWEEIQPYTPIYGGAELDDKGKAKMALLFELIAQNGRISAPKSSQNGATSKAKNAQGKAKIARSQDNLAHDSFKDFNKDLNNKIRGYDLSLETAAARDPRITRLLHKVIDHPVKAKQADLAFTDQVDFQNGSAIFKLHTPDERTASYYQGILNTKDGRNMIDYFYQHQVSQVVVE